MKYKVCSCSNLEGICFKGKNRKTKIIFEMLKLVNMIAWALIKSVQWIQYIKIWILTST